MNKEKLQYENQIPKSIKYSPLTANLNISQN